MPNLKRVLLVILISTILINSQSLKTNSVNVDNHSFVKVSEAINKKWNEMGVKSGYNENGKVPLWKIHKRWEWFWEQRINLQTGEFPTTNSVTEYEKVKNVLHKSQSFNENWTNLGTSSSTGGYSGIGRINCISFHPSDVNTFWVGSPSGGIWKTTDGGSSWTILNNNETTLGVSVITVPSDYASTNTIYIATGDRDGGSMWSLNGGQSADNVSIGVYKSTDGGSTWSATGLTFLKSQGRKIYDLIVNPSNSNVLIAATSAGIYKSNDGGNNWTQKSTNLFYDLEFKPGSTSTIFGVAKIYPSLYFSKSTDNGDNWSAPALIVSNSPRGEMAVTAADPSVVYIVATNSSRGILNVYKSTNSGSSFNAQISPVPAGNDGKSYFGYYSDGSGNNTGQGTYDICIAVSPTNANTVFIGGINTWKSTNSGVSWTINNMWTSYSAYNKSGAPVVHADKHCLEFNGSTLYEGNDGGIYKTTNGGSSWSDLTNGMVISQIYRLSTSQSNVNYVLTGLQDNGSKLYNNGAWSDVKGGDGMECIIDYSDNNYMYASYVQGQISRNTNGFSTYSTTDISANISGGQPTGAWVTPYLIDPNNSLTLFAGYDKVWKTTNRGDSWTTASQVLSSSQKLRSLAIAPSNSNILYAADKTHMWKTNDGGTTNWTQITLPALSNMITYIAIHPTDPNRVWFTVGGYTSNQKIYESTNGGSTWTEISAGLPNLPVMCITHYKSATDRNVLFVGTDLGVYVKDGANNWAAYNTGLPNVVVTELDIFYNNSGTDKLRAATYGRGLWETDIDAALPVELTNFNVELENSNVVSLNWETATEINSYAYEIERKNVSNVSDFDKGWQKIGEVKSSGTSYSPKIYSFNDQNIFDGNKFLYRLKIIDTNGLFEYSNSVEINYIPTEFVLEQNYPNPFNPVTNISYKIPNRTKVSLNIYNELGQLVSSLVNQVQEHGAYKVKFDASNLSSGIYYYTLKTNNFTKTHKMILLK